MSDEYPEYPNVKITPELDIKLKIIEGGSTEYPLTIERKKTRIVVRDESGNRVAIDKREGEIAIDRNNEENIYWHEV